MKPSFYENYYEAIMVGIAPRNGKIIEPTLYKNPVRTELVI